MTKPNLHQQVDTQINNGLRLLDNVDEQFEEYIKQPKNEIMVHFQVNLESGPKMFKGYRIQHNDLLGPFKGGLRFHPDLYLDECKALAAWMTIKCALQEIPYGGGKGGLKIDSREYSTSDLEAISRGFCRALYKYIGEDVDIPAPDMGSNSQIMDWMTNEFQRIEHKHLSACFTGKSVIFGGSKGREQATGRGVVECIKQWYQTNHQTISSKTYIVQGFGNVGKNTAILLNELGLTCIGVADHTVNLINENGFDIDELCEYIDENKILKGYKSITPLGI